MARGVNDVNLYILVHDSGILGKNGNTALTLDIAGVHNALSYLLVGAEYMALLEHGIDQCGLAVVNVSNNGDIAQIFPGGHLKILPSVTFYIKCYSYAKACFDK